MKCDRLNIVNVFMNTLRDREIRRVGSRYSIDVNMEQHPYRIIVSLLIVFVSLFALLYRYCQLLDLPVDWGTWTMGRPIG